jgi:hypothetical protein
MAAVVARAGQIDPMECRRSAERFSPDRVAARYEQVFHAAIASRTEREGRRTTGVPAA